MAPEVPDGALVEWFVARTELACGTGVADGGVITTLCASDGGLSCRTPDAGACISLCEAGQYALTYNGVITAPWRTWDASIVTVDPPSGCVVQDRATGGVQTTEGTIVTKCCPCL